MIESKDINLAGEKLTRKMLVTSSACLQTEPWEKSPMCASSFNHIEPVCGCLDQFFGPAELFDIIINVLGCPFRIDALLKANPPLRVGGCDGL